MTLPRVPAPAPLHADLERQMKAAKVPQPRLATSVAIDWFTRNHLPHPVFFTGEEINADLQAKTARLLAENATADEKLEELRKIIKGLTRDCRSLREELASLKEARDGR